MNSKRKGKRGELELAKKLQEYGLIREGDSNIRVWVVMTLSGWKAFTLSVKELSD